MEILSILMFKYVTSEICWTPFLYSFCQETFTFNLLTSDEVLRLRNHLSDVLPDYTKG